MLNATPASLSRYGAMKRRIMRAVRNAVFLAGVAFALPITCSQPSDGLYTGGIEPSPASRVNPFEPGFANTGAPAR